MGDMFACYENIKNLKIEEKINKNLNEKLKILKTIY